MKCVTNEHGEFHGELHDRVLIVRFKYASNFELVHRINLFLDSIEDDIRTMERPLLRVTDLRDWSLAAPEVIEQFNAIAARVARMGFRYNISIIPVHRSIRDIVHTRIPVDPGTERHWVTTPEEAWEKIAEFGFPVPPRPIFID